MIDDNAQIEQAERTPQHLNVGWDVEPRDNLRRRLILDPAELYKAASRLSIPSSELDELAILFFDTRTVSAEGSDTASVGGYTHNNVTFGEGEAAHTFRHALLIPVRDADDEVFDEDKINRMILHELTHMLQVTRGLDVDTDISYNNPQTRRTTRIAGQVVIRATVAGSWAGFGLSAYKLFNAIDQLHPLPPQQTAVALGAGAAALSLTIGGAFADRAWSNNVRKILHKVSPYEKEARQNETQAHGLSIVTIAGA